MTTCKFCGIEFQTVNNCRYCSIECAESAYQASKVEEFWATCRVKSLRRFRKPLTEIRTKNPSIWEHADTWDRSCNLYLYGGEGIGKSALCKYLLALDVERGRDVCAPPMVAIQQAAFSDPTRRSIQEWCYCSTLLLDDIHDTYLNDKGYSVMRYVIDFRHEACKRTLVTTNKDVVSMMEHLDRVCGDGAGMQMLRRLAPCRKFEMTGKSYRAKMNEEVFA